MEESNSNSQGLDDQLHILKEKRRKLEEITSKLQHLKEENLNIQHNEPEIKPEEKPTIEVKKPSIQEKKEEFDQDRLALTKEEILDFCDRILAKWEKDPTKNPRHIFAMNAVKTSVLWTEEDTIKEIWKEIFKWAFDLLYRNAIAQAKEENLEWSKIMERLGKS